MVKLLCSLTFLIAILVKHSIEETSNTELACANFSKTFKVCKRLLVDNKQISGEDSEPKDYAKSCKSVKNILSCILESKLWLEQCSNKDIEKVKILIIKIRSYITKYCGEIQDPTITAIKAEPEKVETTTTLKLTTLEESSTRRTADDLTTQIPKYTAPEVIHSPKPVDAEVKAEVGVNSSAIKEDDEENSSSRFECHKLLKYLVASSIVIILGIGIN